MANLILTLFIIGALTLFPIVFGIVYMNWAKIYKFFTKKMYTAKFPHKVIRIIIRYPGQKYEEIFRLLPDERSMGIENGEYYISEDELSKPKEINDKVIHKHKDGKIGFDFTGTDVKTGEKKTCRYFIDDDMLSKMKELKMPVVEYWFNCPTPIKFDFSNKKLEVTSRQLKEFKTNDLVSKLLRLNDEKNLMMIIIIITAINLVITIFVLAKLNGWIK